MKTERMESTMMITTLSKLSLELKNSEKRITLKLANATASNQ